MQIYIMSEEHNNIRFVQIIEKFPCLYNYNIPEYSRKDVTEKACEVAEEINSTGKSNFMSIFVFYNVYLHLLNKHFKLFLKILAFVQAVLPLPGQCSCICDKEIC